MGIKRIGIDFDNTIVTYDELFHTHALRLGLIDASVKKSKQHIRDTIRLLDDGETKWIELQAIVYGYFIKDAEPAPGLERFLEECARRSIHISIISHKTQFASKGPQHDLREAARNWIKDRGFLKKFGIAEEDCVFVGTRDEKINEIRERRCEIYIDDLIEVLEDRNWPKETQRILYSANETEFIGEGILRFSTWDEITGYCFERGTEPAEDIVRELLRQHLDEELSSIKPFAKGANSIVYRAEADSGSVYCVKRYFNKLGDDRDRLSTEFDALEFLTKNGIQSTPKALCRDGEHSIGIYEYMGGRHMRPGEVSEQEMAGAIEFVGQLYKLSGAKGSKQQPVASEACFSLVDYASAVRRRLNRLMAVEVRDDLDQELHDLLDEELIPFFKESVAFALDEGQKAGIEPDAALPEKFRMLSPSDFGFQNVLRHEDGSLAFIDFEYFGWDDPAKLIADFFLQPAVPLPVDLREGAYQRLTWLSPKDKTFPKRLPLAYLLSAFKWSLIILNTFLQNTAEIGYNSKEIQLNKAKELLKRTRAELGKRTFPLSLLD